MSKRIMTLQLGSLLLCLWGASACSKGDGARPGGPEGPQARPVPVLAVAAAERDVPIYLEGLGTVTANKTVVVRSQVDGRLQEIAFKEGQPVKRGDLLAQVDPRPFQAQLQQAEGAQARDAAILQASKRNLERYQALLAERLLSQQQVDDQRALVGQQEGALRVDQAQVQSARLQVEYARITSPIDGITGIRQVDQGNLVQKSDAGGIVTITQIDPIAVLFTLPQDDLPRVAQAVAAQASAGAAAKDAPAKDGPKQDAGVPEGLPVDAFGREGQELLGSGRLLVVDNQINTSTATIRLKALFPNPKRALWPNLFVKARLRLTIRRGALVVPLTAVQRGPKGTFVYVVTPEQTAAPRPIELEQSTGDLALLRSGVKPGEQVIVDGQSQLRPGSKVALRASGGVGAEGRGRPDGSPGGGGGGARPGGGAQGGRP